MPIVDIDVNLECDECGQIGMFELEDLSFEELTEEAEKRDWVCNCEHYLCPECAKELGLNQ